MILQKAVLAAEMTLTETAVADDTLGRLAALSSRAANLLGRHGVGRCFGDG